jgi:hypothetical protein
MFQPPTFSGDFVRTSYRIASRSLSIPHDHFEQNPSPATWYRDCNQNPFTFRPRAFNAQRGLNMVPHQDNSEESPLLNSPHPIDNQQENTSLQDTEDMDRRLVFKIGAAMLSFSTLGLFNSSIGAVLPLLSHHYSLTDLHVSLIFLAGPIGYVLAAQFSDSIHSRYGQRGISVIGPVLQVIATTTVALHPSFGVVLVAFAIQGLGTGLLDGSWCAWAGSMMKANTISGLLHGSYSLGGAAGPFLVTVLSTWHHPWWTWYYILVWSSPVLATTRELTFGRLEYPSCH